MKCKKKLDKNKIKQTVCSWCKKNEVLEPNSMAILSGGALMKQKDGSYFAPDDRMQGFFQLYWHGAHDNGKGKDREIGVMTTVVENAIGGNFDLIFCSTECLRMFLNDSIDDLEKKIKEEKKNKR